jgi:hypothetical protein
MDSSHTQNFPHSCKCNDRITFLCQVGAAMSEETKPEEKAKEFDFEEIAKRNKEKEEKLKQERAKANKSVTRSYNLKK